MPAYTPEQLKEVTLARKAREAGILPEIDRTETTPSASGATRRKRGVFNGTSAKLRIDETIPGYHLHIINDDKNRIQEAQDNGYEFVSPKEIGNVSENVTSRNGDIGTQRVRFLVGSKERGEPMYGYLMKQRQEWYDEDQAELAARNNMIDTAVRAGKITGENPAFYVPKDGIKMNNTLS